MISSKLCSGICFDEDEQILHKKNFVQSFLYDVIYHIITLCLLLQMLNPTRKCTIVWVRAWMVLFFSLNRTTGFGLPLPPPFTIFTIHHQMWILGHCFRLSFTVTAAVVAHFSSSPFFCVLSVHVIFEFSMWTTFANNVIFSLHYVETHANLKQPFR